MIDWDEIVRREGSAVWRTAFRLLRNKADADECFQETFMSALSISNRLPVRNWPALLKRLATTRAIDHLRKRLRRMRREELVDLRLLEGSEPEPSERAAATELPAALQWALTQLRTRQAEVFCLHELADCNYEQIAEQFGMSTNAVGVMLHRTRKNCRNC